MPWLDNYMFNTRWIVCVSLYPCDGSVLAAYAVMFWDVAANTVSSTAAVCESEALGILGFAFWAESEKCPKLEVEHKAKL